MASLILNPQCCCPTCADIAACLLGKTLDINISGVSNVTCTHCGDINDTYLFDGDDFIVETCCIRQAVFQSSWATLCGGLFPTSRYVIVEIRAGDPETPIGIKVMAAYFSQGGGSTYSYYLKWELLGFDKLVDLCAGQLLTLPYAGTLKQVNCNADYVESCKTLECGDDGISDNSGVGCVGGAACTIQLS